MANSSRYVPALGYSALTALYDPAVAVTTRERTFKQALIEQANVAAGQRVLDLASGTGTLALMLKQRHPHADVMGIDGALALLSRARAKAERAGVAVRFDQGFSTALPYADAVFARALSTLFFHPLSREDKIRTASEVLRVLKRGGELHVADWGRASNRVMRLLFYGVQLLDGSSNTDDTVHGRLPDIFASVGFEDVAVAREVDTVFGTIALYRARRLR